MDLTKQKCEPCEGGTKPFDEKGARKYLSLLKTEWELMPPSSEASASQRKIKKRFKFKDFNEAMKFVNRVAAYRLMILYWRVK